MGFKEVLKSLLIRKHIKGKNCLLLSGSITVLSSGCSGTVTSKNPKSPAEARKSQENTHNLSF